jgi:hypothetical protein
MTPTTAQRNAVYHALTAMAGQLPFAVRDELAGLLAAPVAPAVTLTASELRELDAAASEYQSGAEKIVYGRDIYAEEKEDGR